MHTQAPGIFHGAYFPGPIAHVEVPRGLATSFSTGWIRVVSMVGTRKGEGS